MVCYRRPAAIRDLFDVFLEARHDARPIIGIAAAQAQVINLTKGLQLLPRGLAPGFRSGRTCNEQDGKRRGMDGDTEASHGIGRSGHA